MTPSSNETAELFGRQSVLLYNIESIIQSSFLADGKQTPSSVETLYAIGATPDGESFHSTVQSTRSEGYLVADKNEWLQQMDAALTDTNVLSAATAPPGFPPQNMRHPLSQSTHYNVPILGRRLAKGRSSLCRA